ncbi:MAG: AAA family ATPase, partial [Gammaproteobacteria bacterium]|nr:AAA family ATPase [Gammaproteobacteria bacterium]
MNPDPAYVTEVPVPTVPQFETVTLAELLDKELPPRENVLAPWLPCQGLAMIHAPRGVGKTHIALGIAYAVACGGSFLRWQAVTPRNVLIIDGEMPAVVLQERLASIVKSGETEPQAKIEFITPDFQSGCM